MVSVTPRPLLTPGKDPVPNVEEAGWTSGPIWTGAENLAPHPDSMPGPSSLWPIAIPTVLPDPREVIGGTKTNICVLAALRTVKWGLTKVGNQEKEGFWGKKKKKLYFVPI